jgi:hypothetical protein
MMLASHRPGFLGVGARVDRFAAEIDAALEPAPLCPPSRRSEIGFGHRRIGAGNSSRFALPSLKHVDGMLDPARLPPVSTIAASVAVGVGGAGLPSVKANSTKPSA